MGGIRNTKTIRTMSLLSFESKNGEWGEKSL